jgi:hypothetical protein
MAMDDLNEVRRLEREISALLAGRPPQVQGATLATLLAKWLAGHIDFASDVGTRQAREELLCDHLDVVRQLIAEKARAMGLPW